MQRSLSESHLEASVDAVSVATCVAEMARDGHFVEVEALFAPPLRAAVSADTLRTAWVSETSKHGPVSGLGAVSEPIKAGLTRVSVSVICAHGAFTMITAVDDAGMLQGLRIAPAGAAAWTPPRYVAPQRFTEREIALGSGPLAVPGTLTLPRGRSPHPGVVLLSGGGPFDRDETSGPNKPLKDLAWGLASRGVAVVRFDKATFAHSGLVANMPEFTMTDEYVPHAVAAVHLLRREPGVDSARVFVLGHSMGGKVAPRVAAAAPVAGLVLLAGEAQPMQRSVVRVARYLGALHPDPTVEASVEAITRQAALVDSPELSPLTPAAELPFGFSGAYWLDLRGYDPVATAATLNKPMLILQGGRDYQVTVEDDLSLWRAGLGHRPDVTIRVYAADNHCFFAGAGPSTSADYETAQHVDPAVVADVAGWLAPRGGVFARFLSRLSRQKR